MAGLRPRAGGTRPGRPGGAAGGSEQAARCGGPPRRRLRLRPHRQRSRCSRERATTLRPPASVEKLYTATAALAALGPSARLTTTVYGVGQLAPGGVWEGSLYLRGGGDPTFGSSAFIASHYGGVGASVRSLVRQLVRTRGSITSRGRSMATSPSSTRCAASPRATTPSIPSWKARSAALAFNRGASGGTTGPTPRPPTPPARCGRALKTDGVSIRGSSGAAARPAGCGAAGERPVADGRPAARADAAAVGQLLRRDAGQGPGRPLRGRRHDRRRGELVEGEIAQLLGIHPRVVDGSGLSRSDRTSPYQVADLLVGLSGTPTGACCAPPGGRRAHRHARKTHAPHRRRGALPGQDRHAHRRLQPRRLLPGGGGHLLAFAIFNDGDRDRSGARLPGPHGDHDRQLADLRSRNRPGGGAIAASTRLSLRLPGRWYGLPMRQRGAGRARRSGV